jgi:hypothetical protein
MFNKSIDDRLSSWAAHRAQLETCLDPFQEVIDFWRGAPFIPYNNKVDQYHQRSWPSPWEIIVDNKYDDFTRALLMAYSLKYTNRFKESVIHIRSIIDKNKSTYYNIVCVDDEWAINYNDNCPVGLNSIPDSFLVENLIEVQAMR